MPSRCLCHAVSRYLPSTWIFRQRKRAIVKDRMLLSNRNRKKQRVYCRSRSTSRSTSRSSLYQCRFCLRPRGKNILRKPLRRKLWLSGSTSNSQRKLTAAIKAVLLSCGNKKARPKLVARSRRSTCKFRQTARRIAMMLRKLPPTCGISNSVLTANNEQEYPKGTNPFPCHFQPTQRGACDCRGHWRRQMQLFPF